VNRRSLSAALLLFTVGCTREIGAEARGALEEDAGSVDAPLDRTRWPGRIVWGFVPYLPEATLRSEFGRLAHTLGQRLELDFEIVVASEYEDLRRKLLRAEVDFAQLAPASYVRAKREMPDLTLVATHVSDGSATYQGYFLTAADSPYRRVEDLRGRRVCWVDPDSTSGYLYPRAILRDRGIDPDTFFAEPPIFSGNHTAALEALVAGGCDAAAVYSGALKQAWSRGVPRDALRILFKSERIPLDAYCLRPGLPESLAIAIRRVLLSISTRSGEGRAVLGRITRINGFMIAFDDAYDGVRRMERAGGRPERR
jgi:phosphate/phosphite/phosphonate ABC transporter binding protein